MPESEYPESPETTTSGIGVPIFGCGWNQLHGVCSPEANISICIVYINIYIYTVCYYTLYIQYNIHIYIYYEYVYIYILWRFP